MGDTPDKAKERERKKSNMEDKIKDIDDGRREKTVGLLSIIDTLIDNTEKKLQNLRLTKKSISLPVLLDEVKSAESLQKECFAALHEKVQRFGKYLDKEPKFLESFSVPENISSDLMDSMMCSYLYRTGAFAAAELFRTEMKIEIPAEEIRTSYEINKALEAMKRKDLSLASKWIQAHREDLKKIRSPLELMLAQVEFMSILRKSKSYEEPLSYAYSRFPHILSNFEDNSNVEEGIARLMGALAWIGRIEESPYTDLYSEENWNTLLRNFRVDGYHAVGLPCVSALEVASHAGSIAIPTILKMNQVTQRTEGKEWYELQELCYEIPLPKDLVFHSIFSCPVHRQQEADGSGPPVLLKCCHVISKSSVAKLPRVSGNRFKCPTCPCEQTEDDIKVIYV